MNISSFKLLSIMLCIWEFVSTFYWIVAVFCSFIMMCIMHGCFMATSCPVVCQRVIIPFITTCILYVCFMATSCLVVGHSHHSPGIALNGFVTGKRMMNLSRRLNHRDRDILSYLCVSCLNLTRCTVGFKKTVRSSISLS